MSNLIPILDTQTRSGNETILKNCHMEYNGSMCWYKAVANERTVIMKEYMNAANTLICTPCPTKVPPMMVAVLLANVNY